MCLVRLWLEKMCCPIFVTSHQTWPCAQNILSYFSPPCVTRNPSVSSQGPELESVNGFAEAHSSTGGAVIRLGFIIGSQSPGIV